MLKFKEFIEEGFVSGKPVKTGVISATELQKHLTKGKFKSVVTHKYHRLYASHPDKPTGYKYERDEHGFEKVHAGHAGTHKDKDGN